MVSVLIMSAGSSRRMGGADKQLLELAGKPVLRRSVEAFMGISQIGEIIVVTGEATAAQYRELLKGLPVKVAARGGETRQQSVFGGMSEVSPEAEFVAIHDGARPLVRREDILRVLADAEQFGAAVLGVAVKDTIKEARDGVIRNTPDRSTLFQVQTPQVFRRKDYLEAMEQARREGIDFTDDAQLFERLGKPVRITQGSYDNLKITTPEDLPAAEAVLKRENRQREGAEMFRVGKGYDVHRLVPGRKLILGGVEIPWEKGLLGHSDADVLLHAVMDGLLGALALGDIGLHFPDTDPAYAGADSRVLLRRTAELVREKGYAVGNLDATVIAQAPKLRPYIDAMRENIAADLGIPAGNVSVKATTEEGLGFTGSGEGISSEAVCLLYRIK